jgi:formylmethanofuran dehydrogenase subunit E
VSGRESTPWDLLAGPVTPPRWQGTAHVHRMVDDQEWEEDRVVAAVVAAGKVCSKCGVTFPACGDYFYRSRHRPDGMRPDCKRCFNELPGVKRQRSKGGA